MNAALPRAVTPPDAPKPFAAQANAIEHRHPVKRSIWRALVWWR